MRQINSRTLSVLFVIFNFINMSMSIKTSHLDAHVWLGGYALEEWIEDFSKGDISNDVARDDENRVQRARTVSMKAAKEK